MKNKYFWVLFFSFCLTAFVFFLIYKTNYFSFKNNGPILLAVVLISLSVLSSLWIIFKRSQFNKKIMMGLLLGPVFMPFLFGSFLLYFYFARDNPNFFAPVLLLAIFFVSWQTSTYFSRKGRAELNAQKEVLSKK